MSAVTILRVNRPKAHRYALILAAATLFAGLTVITEHNRASDANPRALFFAACAFPVLAFFTIRLTGMARSSAVALQMDARGISGLFAGSATWDDISDVSVLTPDARFPPYGLTPIPIPRPALAITLRDPIAFRDHQSHWERLRSWWYSMLTGHHFIISPGLAEPHDPAKLQSTAQTLLTATKT